MPSQSELRALHWLDSKLLNLNEQLKTKQTKHLSVIALSDGDTSVRLPTWGLDAPSSILEINCFAVFAGGPDEILKKNTCYRSLSSSSETEYDAFFNYGLRKGLISFGQSTEVTVPSGPDRSFYLAGTISADGTCEDFSQLATQNKESNFSMPVLLGSAIVDLEPGDKTLEIPIKSSFSTDDQIAYCDEDLSESNPDNTPPNQTPPSTETPPVTSGFTVSAIQTQNLSTSPAGGTYSLTISITNTSSSAFESAITLPAPTAPFSFMSSGCSILLNAGESCVVTYSFSPLSAVAYAQTLPASVTYNGSTQNFNVSLAGAGVLNTTLTVSELYPAFESWNEYVTSASSYSAPAACAGTEIPFDACIHAGEKKKATLGSLYSSCAGLSATDSLGVFKWDCFINGGGQAEMRSVGFQSGKGLRDLVNFTSGSWNPISLSVQYGGSTIFQSPASTSWWLNTFLNLSSYSAGSALTSSGSIYFLNSNLTRPSGWVINADQIGMVFASGVKLTISTPSSLCGTNGESTPATMNGGLCIGNQKFSWIEANIDMNGVSGNGIYLVDSEFNSVHLSHVSGQSGSHAGIKIYNSFCNKITDTEITNSQYGLILTGGTADYNLISSVGIDETFSDGSAGSAVMLEFGADTNTFSKLRVNRAYGTYGAIYLSDAAYNRFFDFTISNSAKGININQGNDNYFTGGTIAHIANSSYAEGISLVNAGTFRNFFSFLTIVATKTNAISAGNNVDDTIFHQILAINSDRGIELQNTLDIFLSQIASVNSLTYPISRTSGTAPIANGIVKFRRTGSAISSVCNNNSTSQNCGFWGAVATVAAASNPFVGPVNDSSQSGAGFSAISSASVPSWLKFENVFRFWGRAMSTTTLIQTNYSTQLTSESVQVFDLSLLSAGTQYLNRSENGSTPNGAMSGTCSSAVDASISSNVRPSLAFNNGAFLMNARENMYETGSGDKDGLCESNESCIYAPNFGAYQGHGNLAGPCTFTGGNGVTGISMYYYTSNGY